MTEQNSSETRKINGTQLGLSPEIEFYPESTNGQPEVWRMSMDKFTARQTSEKGLFSKTKTYTLTMRDGSQIEITTKPQQDDNDQSLNTKGIQSIQVKKDDVVKKIVLNPENNTINNSGKVSCFSYQLNNDKAWKNALDSQENSAQKQASPPHNNRHLIKK